MRSLTQYGRMAEAHWREHCPKLVADLERAGKLHDALLEAEDRTKDAMEELRAEMLKRGATPEQAQRQAWEMVRGENILLPPESPE